MITMHGIAASASTLDRAVRMNAKLDQQRALKRKLQEEAAAAEERTFVCLSLCKCVLNRVYLRRGKAKSQDAQDGHAHARQTAARRSSSAAGNAMNEYCCVLFS